MGLYSKRHQSFHKRHTPSSGGKYFFPLPVQLAVLVAYFLLRIQGTDLEKILGIHHLYQEPLFSQLKLIFLLGFHLDLKKKIYESR